MRTVHTDDGSEIPSTWKKASYFHSENGESIAMNTTVLVTKNTLTSAAAYHLTNSMEKMSPMTNGPADRPSNLHHPQQMNQLTQQRLHKLSGLIKAEAI